MNNRIPLENLYLATPVTALYEGDDPPADPGTPPTPPADPPAKGVGITSDDPFAPIDVDPNANFTQDKVNKIVQDRLAKYQKKQEEKFNSLKSSYETLLADQSISQEERDKLETDYEDLKRQHRTKEEQAKHEKRQLQDKYENELQQYKDAAASWEKQHKDFMIEKSLLDAAVAHDAFQPNQIFDIVRKWTKLVEAKDETGNPISGQLVPVVDLPDVDADTGKPIITQRTPMEAVERLKEKLQPNLFKANVVSGVGGNSSTGDVVPGANGHIDIAGLTTSQYMELRKSNPEKLKQLRSKGR